MRRLPKRAIVLATAAATICGATVALAQTGAESPRNSAVRVLERQAVPSDTLPPTVAEYVKGDRPDADLSTARMVYSDAGRTVYLVRAGDSICLPVVIHDGPMMLSCELSSVVEGGGNRPIKFGFGETLTLMNVVPDSVSSVTLTTSEGQQQSPVENNVYLVDVPLSERDAQLSYSTASGVRTHDASLPPLPVSSPSE